MKETPKSGQQTSQKRQSQTVMFSPCCPKGYFSSEKKKKNQHESSLVNEIFLLFIDLPQGVCSC